MVKGLGEGALPPERGGRGARKEGRGRDVRVPSGEPRRLSELLPEVVRELGGGEAVDLVALRSKWADVVGAELARHCYPAGLEGTVLVVVAESGAWATELRFHAGLIVPRAGRLVGGVRSVAVRVGRLPS